MIMRKVIGIFLSCAIAISVLLGQTSAQVQTKIYVNNLKCKLCHNVPHNGYQFAFWKSRPHSKAFETLKGKKAQRFANNNGITIPPYEAPDCLKCHVTGYDVKTRSAPKGLRMEDGVQCGSCHGPASEHLKDARVLHMNKEAKLELSKNISMPDIRTCIKCHNEESPPWNPEKYTLKSGKKTGFDFAQAVAKIAHPNPNRDSPIAAAIRKAESAAQKK